jgi:hypothetical protein
MEKLGNAEFALLDKHNTGRSSIPKTFRRITMTKYVIERTLPGAGNLSHDELRPRE